MRFPSDGFLSLSELAASDVGPPDVPPPYPPPHAGEGREGEPDRETRPRETCAIELHPSARADTRGLHSVSPGSHQSWGGTQDSALLSRQQSSHVGKNGWWRSCQSLNGEEHLVGVDRRSEERRVGKEGRSRWSPYH